MTTSARCNGWPALSRHCIRDRKCCEAHQERPRKDCVPTPRDFYLEEARCVRGKLSLGSCRSCVSACMTRQYGLPTGDALTLAPHLSPLGDGATAASEKGGRAAGRDSHSDNEPFAPRSHNCTNSSMLTVGNQSSRAISKAFSRRTPTHNEVSRRNNEL